MAGTRIPRRSVAAAALFLLAVAVWAIGRAGGTPVPTGTSAASGASIQTSVPAGAPADGTACVVTRVVDGDTFIAEMDGVRERVRLIGIDTPEIAAEGGAATGEPLGAEAAERLAELAEGRTVFLVRDVSDRDAYDRLLRYAYLEDGTFINRILALEGLADVKRYPPDTARQPELEQAESDARTAGLGIWSAR